MTYVKKWMCRLSVILILFGTPIFSSCEKDDNVVVSDPTKISYRFASKTEGQKLMASNTQYYNNMNQNDIEWRMRKTGATLNELKDFAQTCVLDFTDEEKAAIDDAMTLIEGKLKAMGVTLPFPKEDLVFVKTTMQEEGDAGAYTHKTNIYLGELLLQYGIDTPTYLYEIITHEIFHCLTRNSPEFRRQMYRLIGFTVTGTDYVFAPAIQNWMISNPDVEHVDNYAEFTINGVKRNCALITIYTKTWAEASAEAGDNASFFYFVESVLVPLDERDTYYSTNEATDFWDVVGKNTDYVFAPDECLADNFSDAVIYGLDGKDYKTPQLISDIIDLLQRWKN